MALALQSVKDSPRPQAGGGSSRTVIRGESPRELLVSVDFLTVSYPAGRVQEFVREVAALTGAQNVVDRGKGLHGYESSIDIGGFALVAYGGETQKGTVLVQINGAGCGRVVNFAGFVAWSQERAGRITRLDVAADDLAGNYLTVHGALDAWRRGEFNGNGRPCKGELFSDLGSGRGSTFYAGARLSGKLCRVYEKGKQLGDKCSAWVRGEVEFLAKDRVIPWDAVTAPARYLAGAYRYFTHFSLVPERIRTFKRALAITLEALTAWAREACGRTINVLLERSGGDIGEVVTLLRRAGVPKRLASFAAPPLAMAA